MTQVRGIFIERVKTNKLITTIVNILRFVFNVIVARKAKTLTCLTFTQHEFYFNIFGNKTVANYNH